MIVYINVISRNKHMQQPATSKFYFPIVARLGFEVEHTELLWNACVLRG